MRTLFPSLFTQDDLAVPAPRPAEPAPIGSPGAVPAAGPGSVAAPGDDWDDEGTSPLWVWR
ncbi:hypothetical protein [Wenjunlia tyrosinilytica]|uniref:Uncharacterized protein n=1 Tax=Wenjunlia tyrosinilytica TaxID=1544741 RepID=A0A917ZUG8_9ACTN|nr:hypothetical protein [Wenjunlia tyrosinilytica]GGO94225.1 hypothetical protein GCM10012280_48580 [Wenjunlia tyrosinilytica]